MHTPIIGTLFVILYTVNKKMVAHKNCTVVMLWKFFTSSSDENQEHFQNILGFFVSEALFFQVSTNFFIVFIQGSRSSGANKFKTFLRLFKAENQKINIEANFLTQKIRKKKPLMR